MRRDSKMDRSSVLILSNSSCVSPYMFRYTPTLNILSWAVCKASRRLSRSPNAVSREGSRTSPFSERSISSDCTSVTFLRSCLSTRLVSTGWQNKAMSMGTPMLMTGANQAEVRYLGYEKRKIEPATRPAISKYSESTFTVAGAMMSFAVSVSRSKSFSGIDEAILYSLLDDFGRNFRIVSHLGFLWVMPAPEQLNQLFTVQGGHLQAHASQPKGNEFHALPELRFHALQIVIGKTSCNFWNVPLAVKGNGFQERERHHHKEIFGHNGRPRNEALHERVVVLGERFKQVVFLIHLQFLELIQVAGKVQLAGLDNYLNRKVQRVQERLELSDDGILLFV